MRPPLTPALLPSLLPIPPQKCKLTPSSTEKDFKFYEDSKQRWLAEVLTHLRLSASGHRNIVPALSIVHLPGRNDSFEIGLVMPLAPGSLRDLLKGCR
jgi:hypothetical protein